eukprot:14565012-Alexandrium_andersonii.AAC.1
MSASLVGSEMCIRDRASTTPVGGVTKTKMLELIKQAARINGYSLGNIELVDAATPSPKHAKAKARLEE